MVRFGLDRMTEVESLLGGERQGAFRLSQNRVSVRVDGIEATRGVDAIPS